MAKRLYFPEVYVDETCPEGRASPSDWIVMVDGVYRLAKAEPDNLDCEDGRALHEGDVVAFVWVDEHGKVGMTVRFDGTFDLDGSVPPGINHVWAWGDDDMGDSPGDFAAIYALNKLNPGGSETLTVGLARWQDEGELYSFTVGDDGPRFVRVQ